MANNFVPDVHTDPSQAVIIGMAFGSVSAAAELPQSPREECDYSKPVRLILQCPFRRTNRYPTASQLSGQ
jgi:hypothetical protein